LRLHPRGVHHPLGLVRGQHDVQADHYEHHTEREQYQWPPVDHRDRFRNGSPAVDIARLPSMLTKNLALGVAIARAAYCVCELSIAFCG
jgi:hypothetical protein